MDDLHKLGCIVPYGCLRLGSRMGCVPIFAILVQTHIFRNHNSKSCGNSLEKSWEKSRSEWTIRINGYGNRGYCWKVLAQKAACAFWLVTCLDFMTFSCLGYMFWLCINFDVCLQLPSRYIWVGLRFMDLNGWFVCDGDEEWVAEYDVLG